MADAESPAPLHCIRSGALLQVRFSLAPGQKASTKYEARFTEGRKCMCTLDESVMV